MIRHKIIVNAIKISVKTLINYYQIMDYPIFEELSKSELQETNGGGLIGLAIGVTGLVLACATALGYYNGKKDCMPPPCTDN